MSLQQWRTLWRCTRGVPTRQLLRRGWLTAKRRLVVSAFGGPFRPRRRGVLPLADVLPRRQFQPREHFTERSNGSWWLIHLNQKYRLAPPVDWMLDGHDSATDLQRLAMHYHEFLESVEPHLARDLILDWIDANPPWRSRYWMTNWNCYGLSIRCVCWMQWLADNHQLVTASENEAIIKSLVEQLRFLARNLETDIRGNHLFRNIRCLLWAGRFFDCVESRKWWRTGTALLARELDDQFLDDGMHFELSPGYHCQMVADLLDIRALLPDAERDKLGNRCERVMQALVALMHPDEQISLFSDGGLRMACSPQECCEVWRASGGTVPLPQSVTALRNSGYYGLRTERSFLLVDCGAACAEALPAHGHADMLAFEWDVDGHRVVVDAGVYEYEAGPRRMASRSVASHNTVQVADYEPVELIGSFRIGRRAQATCDYFEASDGRLVLRGHHHGFQSGGYSVTHRRVFDARDGVVSIQDRLKGDLQARCTSRLLFHPECKLQQIGAFEVIVVSRATRILLTSETPIRIVPADWSPDFGVCCRTSRVEMDYGGSPCSAHFQLSIQSP